MEKAKEIDQIIKDNSFMFIPFDFLESGWVSFENVEKPENMFKWTTVVYKTICLIFGLKGEEKKLAHEYLNFDISGRLGTNAFEMFYKKGEYYGVKGEELFACFHFFMTASNTFEYTHYEEVEKMCKAYKNRIRSEYSAKEYLSFLHRFFPKKEKTSYLSDVIENYFK